MNGSDANPGADREPAVDANAPSNPAPADGPIRRVEIPLSALIVLALIVVGTILLLRAIDQTQQLIALALFAGILSTVLGPAISVAQRAIGHIAATVVVHLVVLLFLVVGTGVVLQQIAKESESLASFTEEQIDEAGPGAGETLERSRLDERLGEAAADWGTIAIIGDDDAAGIATRASELTIVIVLSIFFSLQGGSILRVALGWIDDRQRRRRLRELWTAGVAAGATYLRRNMLIAVVSGVGASTVAVAFGLPAVVLVGVWAALLAAVPLLGAVIGWSPLVVLAIIETSTATTLAVAAVAGCGVIVVNTLRARFVVAPVKPGTFLTSMSIAAGLTAAGIPGAVASMFAIVAIVTAITVPRSDDPIDDDDSPQDAAVATGGPAADDDRSLTSDVLHEFADRDHSPDHARPVDRPLVLTLSRRTAAQITAFVVLAFVLQLAITRVGPILVWAIVGALIAVGLDRPVSWAERRLHAPRPVVVIVAAVLATCAVAALLMTATGSIDDARPMDEGIPELVSSLEGLPLLGDSIEDTDLAERIDRFQRDLPRLMTRSPAASQAVGLLGGGVVGAFWVIVAALSCLLDGPRLVAALQRRMPARITRQATRLARAAKVALGGYVAGAAVVAAMNGGIVLLLGLAFGVPLVAVLALWAFMWNFIPQIGAIIGWAPLIVLALLESPVSGIACLGIFAVYQVIENNAIQPTIVGNAVDIGALAALGAALAGAALAGLIGAALAIPIAGVVRALYIESRRDDFPRFRRGSDHDEPDRVLP